MNKYEYAAETEVISVGLPACSSLVHIVYTSNCIFRAILIIIHGTKMI